MNVIEPHADRGQTDQEPSPSQTGVVTLLFTDIVCSTALKQQLGDKAGAALIQQHHALVRQLLADSQGAEEIETAGDSFLLLFPKPSDAVRFALVLQGRLRGESEATALQDRIGIHLGEVVIQEHKTGHKPKDLYGIQIDTCARVMSLASGGQILMSRGVFDSARQVLKGEDIAGIGALEWLNHGPFLLKGLDEPVEVCEVREASQPNVPKPPTTSEKAQRQVRPDEEPVLGWRPAVGQLVPNTRWLLQRKLGEGGFGEVWLGRHETMKERRVFKFCFRADRVRSLKREMTLFRLIKERIGDHPNIVALREVYFEQPPFYVEEDYVDGQDLGSWCASEGGAGNIPLETKLEIIAQVADALQAAHDAGVIHRDVKPANILISTRSPGARTGARLTDDQPEAGSNQPLAISAPKLLVKLTDFGIGQVVSQDCLAGVTKAGFTMTLLGSESSSQTGTQLYMAPELLAGKPASTRSDIYSLGVVLYQVLTGAFTRVVTIDWSECVKDPLLHEDLEQCLAGEPADRFSGASQLARQLRSYASRQTERARRLAEEAERERLEVQAVRRRRVLWASTAGLAMLLLIAAVLGYGLRRTQKEAASARRNLYAADVAAAQRALADGNLGLARRLLMAHRPKPGEEELRGFEWRYLWQKSRGGELWDFSGHSNDICAVAFSPDGKTLASGDRDGVVRIWDVPNRKPLGTLRTQGPGFCGIAFAAQGSFFAATSPKGVRIWNTANWTVLRDILTSEAALPAAFAPNSDWLAVGIGDYFSAGHRGTTVLFSASTGAEIRRLPNSGGRALSFSSDGTMLATAPWNGQIRLWDVASGRELRALNGAGRVMGLSFTPDGQALAGCDFGGKIRWWNVTTGGLQTSCEGHESVIWSMAFSSDGRTLASCSSDQTVRLWDPITFRERTHLRGHGHEVWALAISPDGSTIATGGKDQTLMLWSTAAKKSNPFPAPVVGSRGVPSVAVSSDGRLVAAGTPEHAIVVWRVNDQTVAARFLNTSNHVLRFVKGDRILAAIDPARTSLDFLDLGTQQQARRVALKNALSSTYACDLTPDGQILALALGNGSVVLINTGTGAAMHELRAHDGAVYGVKFSPDGRLLATGAIDATANLWDVNSGQKLTVLQGHRDTIEAIDFSPDGQWVATASWDSSVRIWNVRSGLQALNLEGHREGLRSLAYSPDGRTLASAAADRGTVWNLATQREVLRLPNGTWSAFFAPDGRSLAIIQYAEKSGLVTLDLWHATSLTEIDAADLSKSLFSKHRIRSTLSAAPNQIPIRPLRGRVAPSGAFGPRVYARSARGSTEH